MHIRLVESGDVEALRAIYNPEVIETTVSFDLVVRSTFEQLAWIEEHRGAFVATVAVNEDDDLGEIGARDERILGFASISPFRDRPAYSTTVENSVYVLRSARGRRVGEALLNDLITRAAEHGFHSLIARIVGENQASIALHERCGFRRVGTEIEVGRKHGSWLDVVEYQYVIAESSR